MNAASGSMLLLAAVGAIVAWYTATGVILWLVRRPPPTFTASLLGAGALVLAALFGLVASRDDTSAGGAAVAFVCALIVWGHQEMLFLMADLTGPRRTACAPGARGARRFVQAVQAIAWHELGILAAGLVVLAAAWGGSNGVGPAAYVLLWVMRISAKLNLFLGVRNRGDELLPTRLAYLGSYFGRRPINALFPVSITLGSALIFVLWQAALTPGAAPGAAVAAALLGTLAALAVLEHWVMVLPVPLSALWKWALGRSADAAAAAARAGRGA